MATIQKTESLSYWRQYFATASNSSIFDILDHAITIAASDFPEEFSCQRSRILNSIQGLNGGDRRSDDQGVKEVKAEASKPPPIRIRIKKPSSNENRPIKPKSCVDEVPVDESFMAKPPGCVGEVKPMKPKVVLNEVEIEAKLEATKRKLHDQYEQIENSKRQKRVQVLNFLPKQELKATATTMPRRKKLGNSVFSRSSLAAH